jgi:alginate O-acetyltransferase complex protein AlgI
VLFNSFVFLLFFPVVYGLFRVLPVRARPWLLLPASLLFYGWWDWRFLGLLLLTSIVDWGVARAIAASEDPRRRKALVTVSVVLNLTVLGTFKYLGFFARELDAVLATLGVHGALPVLEVALPVGLSFYTFQAMAYTIDVYRRDTEEVRSLPRFLLFISFFPQLVAGPIERARDLAPQLRELRGPSREQLAEGLQLMVWGYVKKVVVADNLAPLVTTAFDMPNPSGFQVLLGAYAFTWQIYCDFSGYSDIARGVAKWLGVELTVNFDLPFFAASPRELWQRWHITLSRWLRDYLYIPLGGNRHHASRNLLVTMLLGGLWHGANWTYLVWGAWHGLALAAQRRWPVRLPRILAVPLMFHFTCLGFVIFRLHTMFQLPSLVRAVAAGVTPSATDLALARLFVLLVIPVVVLEAALVRRGGAAAFPLAFPRVVQGVVAVAGFVAVIVLGATYGQEFIYFQF